VIRPVRHLRAVLPFAALVSSAAPSLAQRVLFDHTGYRLRSIGERVTAVVRVVDNGGRQVSNPAITFHVADPTVASVSPRGEVVSRRVGNTFVWAVAGRDSASAIVLVEQWPAKFSFAPATLKLDALGAKVALKIQASDAAGNPIAGGATKTSSCRSVNERVASLSSAGEVVSVSNGSTFIRCADRGIADSLRVEVQQRATQAVIDSRIKRATKTVGDTFTVKVTGRDRLARDLVDARPTWASLTPTIVSVDPVTGKAQAKDAGDVKIIAQVGDVADTATINVTGSRAPTSQPAAPVAAPDASTLAASTAASIPKTALFKGTSLSIVEGDTAKIAITARDSSGLAMNTSRLRLEPTGDTSIAVLIDSSRVIGRKQGATTVIARLGGFVDTISINVRLRSTTTTFRSPDRHPEKILQYRKMRDSVLSVIAGDSTARGRTSRLVASGYGMGVMADHSTHPAPDVTETRTGFLQGGGGTLTMFRWLELSGGVRSGTLTPVAVAGQTPGETLSILEGEGNLTVQPASWIGLRAGYLVRTEKTTPATQTWKIPRISLINRFGFVGDFANTYTALSVLPSAQYTGTTEKPSTFSLSGEAGVEIHPSFYSMAFTYYIEQFKFDNSTRVDQYSALRLRLSLSRGF
jgi:hypothetical protein